MLLGTKGAYHSPLLFIVDFSVIIILNFVNMFVPKITISLLFLIPGRLSKMLRQDIGCTDIATVQISLYLF